MAEFQWWLLLVGLVAGGGLVAVVSMEGRRREQDISELEQRAEATWIADQLAARRGREATHAHEATHAPDAATVEDVLRAHREYLSIQPPDRLIVDADDDAFADELDRDADREADHVRDDGRRGPDDDLAPAAEQRAAAGEQAHAGADREQRDG
jgi:hypothetical protein